MGQSRHEYPEAPNSNPDDSGAPSKSVFRDQPLGLRVLVVDDDFINRLALERLLGRMGYDTEGAEDGQQALDALRRSQFDCVFMDIRMAVMDGLEATRRIRAGETGQHNSALPIVAITAHALNGDRERIMRGGVSAYLPKPFFVEDLFAVLQDVFPKLNL